MHPFARAAFIALIISLTPLSALAQVTTTSTTVSPAPGVLLFRDWPQDFVSKFWDAFSSDIAPYQSRLSKWVTPLPNTSWAHLIATDDINDHFTFLYGDTSSATRTTVSKSTLNRVCSLIDPTAVSTDVRWNGEWVGTASEADANRVFIYTPTPIGNLKAGWSDKSQADRSGCPDSAACHYGVTRFSCTTYALPGQTLSASSYSISPGQSVTLSWNDTVYRDTAWSYQSNHDSPPPDGRCVVSPAPDTVCSATGFTPSGRSFAVYNGGEYDAETKTCVNQSSYGVFVINPTGSVTVSPSQTTTYSLSCTNANGTHTVSATVNVAAATIPKPDLTVSTGVSPTTATAGSATTFSATVKNQGAAGTGATFPVLYQKATDSAGSSAANIGTQASTPALAAGASETSTMDTGAALTAGTWYVRACANTTNNSTFVVAESSTTNNCGAWTAVTITAAAVNGSCAATHYNCSAGTSVNNKSNPTNYTWTCAGSGGGTDASCAETKGLPDLTVGAVSPSSANVGQATTLSAIITNAPSAATGAGFPDLFEISKVNNPSLFSQIYASKSYASAALAAGGSNTANVSYAFPAEGTWYVRACANTDTSGNTPASSYAGTPESSYSNNCSSAWTAVAVTFAPCGNGANNPPSCTQCPNNLAYIGGSCVSCSNGGCTGGGGSASNPTGGLSCNNGATNPASCNAFPPSCSTLDTTPTDINTGGATSLTWQCANASSCTALPNSDQFSTANRLSGTDPSVKPSASSGQVTYGMTCGGVNFYFPTVTVHSPKATLTASAPRVRSGDSVTLTGTGSDVKSCSITDDTNGRTIVPNNPSAKDGSWQKTSSAQIIAAQTTFTLTCKTNGGDVTDSAIVNILPNFQEF